MFKRLQPDTSDGGVNLIVDGKRCAAHTHDTVAAVLLQSDLGYCRTTPVSGTPRAPYCMMGVCFDCLVTIDGIGNRQACMVRVREGMHIERQHGKRELGR
ncbi:MAG: (2Fe-2S)-binding protein [Pseudomonadota bacterium]